MRLLGHCKTWCPTVKQIDVKHVDSLLLLFVNLLTYMYNTVCPGLSVFCWSILTVCSRATYIDRLEVPPLLLLPRFTNTLLCTQHHCPNFTSKSKQDSGSIL